MTDLKQVAQQALEALVQLDGLDTETECVTIDVGDVIAALKTALEQQAEPVGEVIDERGDVDYISYVPPVGTVIYTAPPQRPWVGLEAEDLAQIESDEFWQVGNHMAIAMAVEAKLKERNT
jgi:hypothetical protein